MEFRNLKISIRIGNFRTDYQSEKQNPQVFGKFTFEIRKKIQNPNSILNFKSLNIAKMGISGCLNAIISKTWHHGIISVRVSEIGAIFCFGNVFWSQFFKYLIVCTHSTASANEILQTKCMYIGSERSIDCLFLYIRSITFCSYSRS